MADKILIRHYPRYLAEQSVPDQAHFSFGYTIEIENQGKRQIQLIERHWLITDANGQRTELHGPGEIGEQPSIPPGERYAYRSAVQLRTPLGFMQGSYLFQDDNGELVDVAIPLLTLAIPHLIH